MSSAIVSVPQQILTLVHFTITWSFNGLNIYSRPATLLLFEKCILLSISIILFKIELKTFPSSTCNKWQSQCSLDCTTVRDRSPNESTKSNINTDDIRFLELPDCKNLQPLKPKLLWGFGLWTKCTSLSNHLQSQELLVLKQPSWNLLMQQCSQLEWSWSGSGTTTEI